MTSESMWKIMCREIRLIHADIKEINMKLVDKQTTIVTINDNDLLDMKDSLRKVYMIAIKNKEVTATDVSKLTGKSRSNCSMILNQLTMIGKLKKKNRISNGGGPIIVFTIR
jgi:predicted transcriptional regulator